MWFGARGARKFKFSHFFWAAASGQERQALTYLPAHRVQLNRNCAGSGEVQRRHAYDECPQNPAKLTREDLKIAPESPTMKLSETPAVEPSDQTSKTVRHAPLVYRVEEIAQLLAISNRAAYNLCNTTKDFKVIRLGTSIRVSKQSFDDWFAAV